MSNDSKYEPVLCKPGLIQWIHIWHAEAIEVKLIRPPYRPDMATVECLLVYFAAGLSPADAAQACFGLRH